MLDGTVVNLALPRIAEDLDASFAGLQWILNGYTLALAGLILVGGGLGDRFGRRRMFVLGAVGFTVASLLCAVAPNVAMLIGARVAAGRRRGDAHARQPGDHQASFAPEDRGRAIGAWSGLGGVATAIGPFLGGWLVDAASWRWIFLLNVPLGIAVVAVGRAPRAREPRPRRHRPRRLARRRARRARPRRPDARAQRGVAGWLAVVGAVRARRVRARSSGARATRSCRWRCSGRRRSAARTS